MHTPHSFASCHPPGQRMAQAQQQHGSVQHSLTMQHATGCRFRYERERERSECRHHRTTEHKMSTSTPEQGPKGHGIHAENIDRERQRPCGVWWNHIRQAATRVSKKVNSNCQSSVGRTVMVPSYSSSKCRCYKMCSGAIRLCRCRHSQTGRNQSQCYAPASRRLNTTARLARPPPSTPHPTPPPYMMLQHPPPPPLLSGGSAGSSFSCSSRVVITWMNSGRACVCRG